MSDIRFSQAASAYQDALRAAQNIVEKTSGGSGAEETKSASSTSFLDMVGTALKGAVDTGYKSEAVSTKSLLGKANMTDVVTAVADAETALNTVVAIRDRVINAYQDIIKMPV
jgi:flagellar hook-basal body complex protein FliE